MLVKLSHFSRAELLQSGSILFRLPPDLEGNLVELAVRLQALRYSWGKPIFITSGYRSPEHNKQIGGVPNSLHCQAKAVDCYSDPLDEFWRHIDRYWAGGAILYAGHVHLDTGSYYRGKK